MADLVSVGEKVHCLRFGGVCTIEAEDYLHSADISHAMLHICSIPSHCSEGFV